MGEGSDKRPFDIDEAMTRIRNAVRHYPKAAMFELAERGHASPFEQLIACLISVRTYDEVSLPAALRLFDVARTPETIADLPPAEINALIHPATFHDRKAVQIRDIESISYWTKAPAGEENWFLNIYTDGPGDAPWYGKRFFNDGEVF